MGIRDLHFPGSFPYPLSDGGDPGRRVPGTPLDAVIPENDAVIHPFPGIFTPENHDSNWHDSVGFRHQGRENVVGAGNVAGKWPPVTFNAMPGI